LPTITEVITFLYLIKEIPHGELGSPRPPRKCQLSQSRIPVLWENYGAVLWHGVSIQSLVPPISSNNVLFIVLELATGFTNKYSSFLACRAFFGITMGGLYGNAAATAMEDCPPAARGIISGMFQVGCSLGYLFATVFARALVTQLPMAGVLSFGLGLVHKC
jgi:MFS family permease